MDPLNNARNYWEKLALAHIDVEYNDQRLSQDASPEKIYNLCSKRDIKVNMIYQPFKTTPVNYKKFRPILILSYTKVDNS